MCGMTCTPATFQARPYCMVEVAGGRSPGEVKICAVSTASKR
jgi:hypothetical protein